MTWSTFWTEVNEIRLMINAIAVSFPEMLMKLFVFGFTMSCLWVMIKLVREVRS